jgi:hypothetical protein
MAEAMIMVVTILIVHRQNSRSLNRGTQIENSFKANFVQRVVKNFRIVTDIVRSAAKKRRNANRKISVRAARFLNPARNSVFRAESNYRANKK